MNDSDNEGKDIDVVEDRNAVRTVCHCPGAAEDPLRNCTVGLAQQVLANLQDSGLSEGEALGVLGIAATCLDKAMNGDEGSAARLADLLVKCSAFKAGDIFAPHKPPAEA